MRRCRLSVVERGRRVLELACGVGVVPLGGEPPGPIESSALWWTFWLARRCRLSVVECGRRVLELACGAFETVCGRHGTVTMLESRITRGRAPRLGASKPLLVVASFEQPVGKLGVALLKDGVVGVEFLGGVVVLILFSR